MARQKRKRKVTADKAVPLLASAGVPLVEGPLRTANGLCTALAVVGLVMFATGMGVTLGGITDGWGFPMSAVPNWGRPWGLVLAAAGALYVYGLVLILLRPRTGSAVMILISGLSVLLGTPLITTTAEIVYNLFRETKARPDWIDSIWAYFIILNVAICVAICRAYPAPEPDAKRPARSAF